MRALLDLMSENGVAVQENLLHCRSLLGKASTHLQILDQEQGEQELVKSVAAELAKVKALIAKNSQREQGPGGA